MKKLVMKHIPYPSAEEAILGIWERLNKAWIDLEENHNGFAEGMSDQARRRVMGTISNEVINLGYVLNPRDENGIGILPENLPVGYLH